MSYGGQQGGQAGYFARMADWAREQKRRRHPPPAPMPPPDPRELDGRRPPAETAWVQRDRELYLRDQTPGYDEAFVSFGRVDPQPPKGNT